MAAASEVLGAGGFGAVFKPALPNTIDGKVTPFPGNVSKVFFNQNDADALLYKRGIIRRVMGENEGHRINAYKRKFRGENMPASVFSKLTEKNPDISHRTPLTLVRMPDLGKDLQHINKTYPQIRRVPVQTILEQIQKLIRQTASLAAHDYIHGDIRTTNIMINPETGVMTIVDFDWLMENDEFMDEYNFGFYSNPPEWLLYDLFDKLMEKVGDRDISVEDVEKTLASNKTNKKRYVNYIKDNKALYPNAFYDLEDREFEIWVLSGIAYSAEYLRSMGQDVVGNLSLLETFDNFGLGLSLLDMIRVVYAAFFPTDRSHEEIKAGVKAKFPHLSDTILNAFVPAMLKTITLLQEMSAKRVDKRPTPASASERMNAIVAEFKAAVPAINNNAHAELGRLELLEAPNLPASPSPSPLSALSSIESNRNLAVSEEGLNSEARTELNRMRALEGVVSSPKGRRRATRGGKRNGPRKTRRYQRNHK